MLDRVNASADVGYPSSWAPLLGLLVGMLLGGFGLAGVGMVLNNNLMLFILSINGAVAGSLAGYHLIRQLRSARD